MLKFERFVRSFIPKGIREEVTKHVPLAVHSFAELFDVIEKEQIKGIEAHPGKRHLRGNSDITEGLLDSVFEYFTDFRAETSTGRPVIYHQSHGEIEGSGLIVIDERGINAYALQQHQDYLERKNLTAFITAEDRLKQIKEKFPNLQTDIVRRGREGKFDEDDYRRLHSQAQLFGVTPWPQEEKE